VPRTFDSKITIPTPSLSWSFGRNKMSANKKVTNTINPIIETLAYLDSLVWLFVEDFIYFHFCSKLYFEANDVLAKCRYALFGTTKKNQEKGLVQFNKYFISLE
jgi:hypothetical protein